jgi:hypothetical protein
MDRAISGCLVVNSFQPASVAFVADGRGLSSADRVAAEWVASMNDSRYSAAELGPAPKEGAEIGRSQDANHGLKGDALPRERPEAEPATTEAGASSDKSPMHTCGTPAMANPEAKAEALEDSSIHVDEESAGRDPASGGPGSTAAQCSWV